MPPYDKLESKLSWVYLINLVFYIIPLFAVSFAPWEYLLMALALVLFLVCYFWAYRCQRQQLHWPIVGIVLVATLITPINSGSIAMFAYAGFFIGFAYTVKRYLLLMSLLIVLLVALDLSFSIPWDLFLVMGVPIILAVSLLGRAEQSKLQRRLAELKSTDEIKQLATMLERERIGRDLHDLLGHTLSSIILKADLAEKLLARQQSDAAQQQLTELSQIARTALSQVRQSVSGYQHHGLAAEVTKLLDRLRDAGCEAQLDGEIPQLDSRHETTLILALTELVTNVMRHSQADRCQLRFSRQAERLQIQVTDNGQCKALTEGNGIQGLRQRLAAIGASLTLKHSAGLCATIELPLTGSAT